MSYLLGLNLMSAALAQSISPQQVPPQQIPPEQIPILEDQLLEPTLPENLPETPLEAPPEVPLAPPQAPSPFTPPREERFRVESIEFLGVSLTPTEFNQLTAQFEGKETTVAERISAIEGQEITLDDLLTLRAFISEAYVNAGYLTSGAFLPQQAFTDGGSVQIQVVEGILETLEIRGLQRLRKKYVRDRILARVRPPLRHSDLVEALQLLQSDSIIERVDAELLTGSGPGLSILSLNVVEAPPLTVGLSINNYRAPSLGSEQITPSLEYTNLLGLGDRLNFSYSLTPGLNSYVLDYSLPITPENGTFNFRFATSNSRIVEDSFEELGIRSDNRTLAIGVRQPLVRTPAQEFALGAELELRRSRTFILDDMPFPFAPGSSEDGESRISAIRFFQDWVNRTESRVLAARSQFSFGIGAFDATVNEAAPDGLFFSWLGQFQWVQRLPKNSILVTRLSTQLTPDSLLSLEQFSQGGVRTVRGYVENQLVTDNGFIGSVEWRLPLSADPNELLLTPFVEGGLGWNTGEASEGLASLGVGLQWQIDPNVRFRVDYGYPLIDVDVDGDSLQAEGVYLSLDWALR